MESLPWRPEMPYIWLCRASLINLRWLAKWKLVWVWSASLNKRGAHWAEVSFASRSSVDSSVLEKAVRLHSIVLMTRLQSHWWFLFLWNVSVIIHGRRQRFSPQAVGSRGQQSAAITDLVWTADPDVVTVRGRWMERVTSLCLSETGRAERWGDIISVGYIPAEGQGEEEGERERGKKRGEYPKSSLFPPPRHTFKHVCCYSLCVSVCVSV